MALPINHLKRTLDRCCGQWEFVQHDPSDGHIRPWCATVRFLNTRIDYQCIQHSNGKWRALTDADGYVCHRLTGILNGHQRNDAGDLPSDFACVPGVE